MRSTRRALLSGLLFAVASSSDARADTLEVGSPFPDLQFQQIADATRNELTTLRDVQKGRAIVFVFASW